MDEKFDLPPIPPTSDDLDDLKRALDENRVASLAKESDLVKKYRKGEIIPEETETDLPRTESTIPKIRNEIEIKPITTEEKKIAETIAGMVQVGLIEQIKDHKSYPDFIHSQFIERKAISLFNDLCELDNLDAALKLKEVMEISTDRCLNGMAKIVKDVFEDKKILSQNTSRIKGEYDRMRYSNEYEDYHDNESVSERDVQEQKSVHDNARDETWNKIAQLPKEILESAPVQKAAREAFLHNIPNLSRGVEASSEADTIIKTFGLTKEFMLSKGTLESVSLFFEREGEEGRRGRIGGYPLSDIAAFERYFASPQFYAIPQVRKVAVWTLYDELTGVIEKDRRLLRSRKGESNKQQIIDAQKRFGITEEEIKAEAELNFKDKIKSAIDGYHLDEAAAAARYLNLAPDQIMQEVMSNISLIEKDVGKSYGYGGEYTPKKIEDLVKRLGIPQLLDHLEFQNAVQRGIVKMIDNFKDQLKGKLDPENVFLHWTQKLAEQYKGILGHAKEGLLSSYLQQECEEKITKTETGLYPAANYIKLFTDFFPDFSLTSDSLKKKLVVNYLSHFRDRDYFPDHLAEVREHISISNSLIQSSEVQLAAKDAAVSYLNKGLRSYRLNESMAAFKNLIKLATDFYMSPDMVKEILITSLTTDSTELNSDKLKLVKSELRFNAHQLRDVGDALFRHAMNNGNDELAETCEAVFNVSPSILKEFKVEKKEQDKLITAIRVQNIEAVRKIIGSSQSKPNPATLPEVVDEAAKQYLALILSGDINKAGSLVSYIPLATGKVDLSQGTEAYKVIEKAFIEQINFGYGNPKAIYNKFHLALSPEQICEKLDDGVINKCVSVLEIKFPRLYNKFFSSIDAFFIAVPILKNEKLLATLETYPFLENALENNDQYGIKLLTKFESLDRLSKANIKELYDNKENIETTNKGINPDSRDFRIAMQMRLEAYRRNKEITNSIGKLGVDVENWLNAEDEIYFDLGHGTESVTQQIDQAVIRIGESVEAYIAEHKEIVGEFEKELSEYKVPTLNLNELRAKLEKMTQELAEAKQTNNTRLIAGTEKGITNLEAQLRSPKMVTAWSRFIGDIGRLTALKKDIMESCKVIKSEEEKMAALKNSDKVGREHMKQIKEIKTILERQKANIYKKTSKLKLQVADFETELTDTLVDTLGPDRTSTIVQEISQSLAEPLNHFENDTTSLERVLADEKQEKLDGNTMRIGLWSRDPDTDLYLGNYTHCCISIDSDPETIVDYVTDLGMQTVCIYDENKEIPIAAAWCWIGSKDDDTVALVIDNVELNNDYIKYAEQLKTKLKGYIQQYAKNLNVKSVVQGKKHNDLIVANLSDEYYKLGGYNRASGYFLEAEAEEE